MSESMLYQVIERKSPLPGASLKFYTDQCGGTVFDCEDALMWCEIAKELNPYSEIFVVLFDVNCMNDPDDYKFLMKPDATSELLEELNEL